MSRLTQEFSRLYLQQDAEALLSPEGRSRALVLALRTPADWSRLGRVWHGVQQELALPAPAIAVSGTDALQLWFSLAQAVDLVQAQAFLQGLRQRYLADLPAKQLELLPRGEPPGPQHAARIPAEQAGGEGLWSAFVAPDLAPVFADAPWLDVPPSEEGQADLLRPLASIKPEDFAVALASLAPAATPAPAAAAAANTGRLEDPRLFLLQVMNDASTPLALRIEAAKALLSSPAAR